MIVCIDSGNSRIKWGVHDDHAWIAQGAVTHAELSDLAELTARWPAPRRVMLANVAGAEVGDAIRAALAAWSPLLCEVRSSPAAAGVRNSYDFPERLGVDRWCALIGARGSIESACVVVMAGTATTIDSMSADGVFLGGMILPGLDLMCRSLASATADLPFAQGQVADFPRCTDDAIVTGCLEAQLGAIERAVARLDADRVMCVLSGGNAARLGARLVIPHVLAHNLPLEGLRRLAAA